MRVVQTAGRREKAYADMKKGKDFSMYGFKARSRTPTCKIYARQIGDENVGQTAKV